MPDLVVQLLHPIARVAGDVVIRSIRVDAGLGDGSLRALRALAETCLISNLKDFIIKVIIEAGYHRLPSVATFLKASMATVEAGLEGWSKRRLLALAHPSRVSRAMLDVIEAEPLRDIVVKAVRVQDDAV